MGTFVGYVGSQSIPEDIREQFCSQMIKILNYGGMMGFDEVRMFGHDIGLLKPVTVVPGGTVWFHYNYFEDDAWEDAGFNAGTMDFWTEKVGGREFHSVAVAAYTLCDLYNERTGFVECNGDPVDPYPYVGWINHLLGTSFNCGKRLRLWELAELYAIPWDDEYQKRFSYGTIWDILPLEIAYYAGGTDLADLCYITCGTKTLDEAQIAPDSYPADILLCKTKLSDYLRRSGEDSSLENIWKLVQMERGDRAAQEDPLLRDVAETSLFLPSRVIVYLASEITGQDFWENWKQLRDSAYHDETQKSYASEELLETRRITAKKPVPGLRTSDFLREDGWFTFHGTPDELKDKPKYFVSDDDRLYWWDGSDEVVLSEGMDQWLCGLAERHAGLMEVAVDASLSPDEFLQSFLGLLAKIDSFYQRLFPFQSMFYEFIQNGHRKEYLAAVALLRELYEENKEEGKAIQHLKGSWDLCSRKVTFNPGRLRMKRFMAFLANAKLRKKYFGF